MFALVRDKLESASKIDTEHDALLFIDALPDLTKWPCQFGWGAVHYDWDSNGHREWGWEDTWLWHHAESGRYGLRMASGFELLLDDLPGACPAFPVDGGGFHMDDWVRDDDRPTR